MPFNHDYLARLREGDAETERHFVAHFSNAIRLSLRYRLRSWQLIDDIRQETFLRVLNFLRSDRPMDHPERLGAYVHSVCINVMMELLRASTRHPAMPEDAQDMVDRGVNPESEAVTNERKDMVRSLLDELPEKDRRILRAVFLEDMDKDEVCKRFDVTRDYLRVLVHRAKIRFRAALNNQVERETAERFKTQH
ncbi:MAG TPA: sigma-70 family RNA polymerase sigma factor [Bryobacteraceae bacterium]|nr:sigma-70 family RNA polymerase sigma factor [Bryobacteraceae bacterium]